MFSDAEIRVALRAQVEGPSHRVHLPSSVMRELEMECDMATSWRHEYVPLNSKFQLDLTRRWRKKR